MYTHKRQPIQKRNIYTIRVRQAIESYSEWKSLLEEYGFKEANQEIHYNYIIAKYGSLFTKFRNIDEAKLSIVLAWGTAFSNYALKKEFFDIKLNDILESISEAENKTFATNYEHESNVLVDDFLSGVTKSTVKSKVAVINYIAQYERMLTKRTNPIISLYSNFAVKIALPIQPNIEDGLDYIEMRNYEKF